MTSGTCGRRHVSGSIVNLLNSKPPLSSDSRGYDPSQYNLMARGLSWSLQLTKKF